MKKLSLFFIFLCLFASASIAQNQPTAGGNPTHAPGAPTGSCLAGVLYTNSTNGFVYSCNAGTWSLITSSSVTHGVGAPIGSCSSGSLYTNDSNGNLYSCDGGTWVLITASGVSHGSGAPVGSCSAGGIYTNDTNGSLYSCSSGSWVTTTNVNVIHGSGAPVGSCTAGFLYTNDSSGNLYSCSSGSWLIVANTTLHGSSLPVNPCVSGYIYINDSNGNFYTCTGGTWLLNVNAVNAAVIPDPSSKLRYVANTCNGGPCFDSNNGLSLGTAKATIYNALQTLPGGITGQVGEGMIICVSDCIVGSPVPGGGIWIMGPNDPNYSNPPLGWLKAYPFGTNGTKILGYAQFAGNANSRDLQSQISDCGNQFAGPTPPCLWLSSVGGFSVENIQFPGLRHGQLIKLGIASNGNRNGVAGSSGILIRNVGGGVSQGLGDGPCIDIGSNVFWTDLIGIACSGSGRGIFPIVASTGLSRSGNVVTATTTITNDISVGQNITVWNADDPLFNGNFIVTSVSGSPQTVVTWAQNGPSATSGRGEIWTDRDFSIAVNPGTGTGSGAIRIRDLTTSSGGVRSYCAQLDGDDLWLDTSGPPSPPLVEEVPLSGCNGSEVSHFNNIQMADVANSVPAFLSWLGTPSLFSVDNVTGNPANASGTQNVTGAAIVLAQDAFATLNQTIGGAASGQLGYLGNHILGQEDAARSLFSPTAVRFPNLATFNTGWTDSGAVTRTSGITAKDGTTGAVQLVGTSGTAAELFYVTGFSVTPNPNDWYLGGVWIRSTTGIKPPGLTFNFCAQGFTCTNDYFYGGSQSVTATADIKGDGGWYWESFGVKVWTGPSTTAIAMGIQFDNVNAVQVYSPILLHIPSSAGLSDNEVSELLRNLSTYPSNALAGDVSMLPGQRFLFDHEATMSNCAAVGTSANPSLAACGSASSGQFSCATAATGGTCTVATTAVTANSEIFVFESDTAATGTRLGVTCNTGTTVIPTSRILASYIAGTSFTINLGTVTTNPACFNYFIIN